MVHCHRNERKNRDKNIAVLLENLPHSLRGLWLSLEEILKVLNDGGAKSVSYKELKYLFARSEKITLIFLADTFKTVHYYCYGPSLNNIGTDRSTTHRRRLKITVDYFNFFGSRQGQESLNNIESGN